MMKLKKSDLKFFTRRDTGPSDDGPTVSIYKRGTLVMSRQFMETHVNGANYVRFGYSEKHHVLVMFLDKYRNHNMSFAISKNGKKGVVFFATVAKKFKLNLDLYHGHHRPERISWGPQKVFALKPRGVAS